MDGTCSAEETAPVGAGPASWVLEEHYRRLPGVFYTLMAPEGVGARPALVHVNPAAGRLLDMAPGDLLHPDFLRLCAGNAILAGFQPLAQVYAGHQFGGYVPQLGDGRALLVAQVRNRAGALWDVQIKGGGRTPYSRFGDGRAVLRSCIREYLGSEAMAALGIPTTRALAVMATGEPVRRETMEPGAVLTRLAPSHVRFGHFEYFHHTRRPEAVKALADHVMAGHFPDLVGRRDGYEAWFGDVVQRTAHLMADWLAVGFAHGVMNTDNMSILGLTIDYGPFGFLDACDPSFICNHSDPEGRYAFDRQPDIAFWNLRALATALRSLIPEPALRAGLTGFGPAFSNRYHRLMTAKLGLVQARPEDEALVRDLLELMARGRADYTLTFRRLSRVDTEKPDTGEETDMAGRQAWLHLFPPALHGEVAAWLDRRRGRLLVDGDTGAAVRDRPRAMDMINPKYVLRNWVAETTIRAVEDRGDVSVLDRILRVLQSPFAEHPDAEDYAAPPPPAMTALCVSCSS